MVHPTASGVKLKQPTHKTTEERVPNAEVIRCVSRSATPARPRRAHKQAWLRPHSNEKASARVTLSRRTTTTRPFTMPVTAGPPLLLAATRTPDARCRRSLDLPGKRSRSRPRQEGRHAPMPRGHETACFLLLTPKARPYRARRGLSSSEPRLHSVGGLPPACNQYTCLDNLQTHWVMGHEIRHPPDHCSPTSRARRGASDRGKQIPPPGLHLSTAVPHGDQPEGLLHGRFGAG